MIAIRSAKALFGNGQTSNQSSFSFTPDPSWQVGDFMFGFLAYMNGAAFTNAPGWASAIQANGASITLPRVHKVADAADLAATHTFSIGTATRFVAVIMALTGVDTANPIDAATGNNPANGTTLASAAHTTIAASTFLLTAWAMRSTAITGIQTITPPPSHNITGQQGTNSAGTTNQVALGVGDLIANPITPGAYGGYDATASVTSAAASAWQVSLNPAAPLFSLPPYVGGPSYAAQRAASI